VLGPRVEHIVRGSGVVHAAMKMVGSNRRYLYLFAYPEGMVDAGGSVADLIRYNAERGECGPGDVDAHVAKRIAYMRQGSPHVFERKRADGKVLELRGRPIPGGGFVTTFADVTHFKQTERTLANAKEALEIRVAQRTAELETALQAQQQAKLQAEQANQSKTHFLAAASHDLLQPMNAARLFSSALSQHPDLSGDAHQLARQVDSSLRGAEELLSALLDISRLDAGALNPHLEPIALSDMLRELTEQVRPVAEQRHLQLRLHLPETAVWIRSDRQWLRRILQNLINNALRYTREGGVLIGLRREGLDWRIEVRDTGPGIPAGKQAQIFQEFQRGGEASPWGEKGMGLGLAIVDRMARLLQHPLAVSSAPGRGACFTVTVPRCAAQAVVPLASETGTAHDGNLQGLRVLCIDNEPDILAGMQALLSRWGCTVFTSGDGASARQLLAEKDPQVVLADYHLADNEDGLLLLRELSVGRAGALVTADHTDEVASQVRSAGLGLLRKPVKPAALRAFLSAQTR